jgi:hypothetical protein
MHRAIITTWVAGDCKTMRHIEVTFAEEIRESYSAKQGRTIELPQVAHVANLKRESDTQHRVMRQVIEGE